jgi:hypothetical protein
VYIQFELIEQQDIAATGDQRLNVLSATKLQSFFLRPFIIIKACLDRRPPFATNSYPLFLKENKKSCPKYVRTAFNQLKINLKSREDRISFADPLLPPSYSRSPVPTSSGLFCFPVRSGKQAFRAPGKTKPAAFAAGFLSVGKTGFELACK